MRSNFLPSLARVLSHEGGKVDDPRDPGGRTAYGVTQRVYDDWRRSNGLPGRDVWSISEEERAAIYKRLYWDAIRGDDLPSGLDYCLFDFAVNSGPARAARFLQRALGIADDGKIGPATLAAVAKADPRRLIAQVCAARQRFLEALPTYARFGRGWSRRVVDVETCARGMA